MFIPENVTIQKNILERNNTVGRFFAVWVLGEDPI